MAFFELPQAPGRKIHFEVYENILPENTLFLHGNLASNRWWTPVRHVWEESKASDFKGAMILAEFRGCGQSTAPANPAEVDMQTFALDFLALLKKLNLGPVNIVGHSTGGLIAALMAALDPGAVKKLVLLDPVGAGGVRFDPSMLSAFEAMKADRALTGVVIGGTILNNDPSSTYFENQLVTDAYSAVKNVGAWVLQALDGLDVRSQIRNVKVPSLVLHGEQDTLLPRKDSEEIAQLMGGRFQVLAGCGHCANVEKPKFFCEVVHSFLFAAV